MTVDNPRPGGENPSEQHRAQVGVECPQCHYREFVEVDSDLVGTFQDSKVARSIHAELQAWMLSRCPQHLRTITSMSKN
jgi:hypothetical protein